MNTYSEILKYELLEDTTNENYFNTVPKSVAFTSESLFTKRFINQLNSILNMHGNSGKNFRKLSKSQKMEIVAKLEDLLQTETRWRDLVKNTKYDSEKILDIFPEEYAEFKILFKNGFFPAPEIKYNKKENQRYASEKVKFFSIGLLKYIQKNMSHILTEEGKSFQYSEEELDTLVDEILVGKQYRRLFQDIVKICMKKAYDTNVNIESNHPTDFNTKPLNSNFLKAKKTDLLYPVYHMVSIFVTNNLLNDLVAKKLTTQLDPEFVIDVLKTFDDIYKTLDKIEYDAKKRKKNWHAFVIDIGAILLSLFERTQVVQTIEKVNRDGTVRQNLIYIFNHKLDNSIAFSKHLPRITPPVIAETNKCVNRWVAPVKKGHFNAQISKEALTALNNAQRKEFVINKKYLNLLQDVDKNRESTPEFPTQTDFARTGREFEEWSDSAWNSVLDVKFYRVSRNIIRVKKKRAQGLHSKMLGMCGLSHLESHANAAKNSRRNDLVTKRSMRQLLLTSIQIGELYKDYPLYYSTLLDFRLRMYPLQYLMSRTSGYLKNILEESKKRILTQKGITNMLEAYYSPDKLALSKFRNLAPTEMNQMFEFFKTNKIDMKKEPLYFELLNIELNDIFNSIEKFKKTALQLEIDQVGSGPTLVALVTRNKMLAEKCNLFGGEFVCIYTFLLKETVKYFEATKNLGLEIDIQSSKAYRLLTENRKAQKYALMCFFYNEQHRSRTERWIDQFEEEFGITVEDEDYQVFSKFSINYSKFMDTCFPNLSKQLNLLNEAMMMLVKQDLPAKIETLDGCILSWDFSNTTEIKRNFYNPVSGAHEQFKVHISNKKSNKKSNRRINKHRQSFKPNIIHSLDAAIMRIFLQKFYKRTKTRLNHLHDCVMIHPNDVDIFYDIVTETYCSSAMKTLAQDLFFSRIKKDLVGDPLEAVIKLEKQFLENVEEFDLTEATFNPRKCYRYEGTK